MIAGGCPVRWCDGTHTMVDHATESTPEAFAHSAGVVVPGSESGIEVRLSQWPGQPVVLNVGAEAYLELGQVDDLLDAIAAVVASACPSWCVVDHKPVESYDQLEDVEHVSRDLLQGSGAVDHCRHPVKLILTQLATQGTPVIELDGVIMPLSHIGPVLAAMGQALDLVAEPTS